MFSKSLGSLESLFCLAVQLVPESQDRLPIPLAERRTTKWIALPFPSRQAEIGNGLLLVKAIQLLKRNAVKKETDTSPYA